MSHGSELNQPSEHLSEKPNTKNQVTFSEFRDAINEILTKYSIKNFHITCSLTLSLLYLNTKHEEEEEE